MTQKTYKQIFATHPVPAQSLKHVYVYVFYVSFPDSLFETVSGLFPTCAVTGSETVLGPLLLRSCVTGSRSG